MRNVTNHRTQWKVVRHVRDPAWCDRWMVLTTIDRHLHQPRGGTDDIIAANHVGREIWLYPSEPKWVLRGERDAEWNWNMNIIIHDICNSALYIGIDVRHVRMCAEIGVMMLSRDVHVCEQIRCEWDKLLFWARACQVADFWACHRRRNVKLRQIILDAIRGTQRELRSRDSFQ